MKSYLNIVRKVNVQNTDDAQKLLKSYSDTIQIDREGKSNRHFHCFDDRKLKTI